MARPKARSFAISPSRPQASTHQLPQILRRPPRLRKADAPFYALQELPGDLITHDVRLLSVRARGMELFPSGAFMNAHHGDADWPGSFTYRQGEVGVVGFDVPAALHRGDDFTDWREEGRGKGLRFEMSEEGR